MTETLFQRMDRESRERHLQEVIDGRHDEQCEWGPRIDKGPTGVERRVHMGLCHCDKRKRIASGFIEPPGELWYRNPDCPKCYQEVEHDGDSFVCYTCHVSWDPRDPGDKGAFTDDYGDLGRPVREGDPA